MQAPGTPPTPEHGPERVHEGNKEALEHVAEAHRLLQALRERMDQHPELDEAIERLEMALAGLTLRTGAML